MRGVAVKDDSQGGYGGVPRRAGHVVIVAVPLWRVRSVAIIYRVVAGADVQAGFDDRPVFVPQVAK